MQEKDVVHDFEGVGTSKGAGVPSCEKAPDSADGDRAEGSGVTSCEKAPDSSADPKNKSKKQKQAMRKQVLPTPSRSPSSSSTGYPTS